MRGHVGAGLLTRSLSGRKIPVTDPSRWPSPSHVEACWAQEENIDTFSTYSQFNSSWSIFGHPSLRLLLFGFAFWDLVLTRVFCGRVSRHGAVLEEFYFLD